MASSMGIKLSASATMVSFSILKHE
uniref:Uncharacterized protein n=1 Tax=Arundo donax TaxID=35708 RepID=A0A0A8Z5M0_ARUDO